MRFPWRRSPNCSALWRSTCSSPWVPRVRSRFKRVDRHHQRQLGGDAAAGRFRDLYHRLTVVTLRLPPLREQSEAIPDLARKLLGDFCGGPIRPVPDLSSEAMRALQAYPGREMSVNYGNSLAGRRPPLLQKFSLELRTASRATDMIGRWGGDEFILVLNCGLAEAGPQIERLRSWVCQDYAVHTRTGTMKLKVEASIGLAERTPADAIKDLLARADAGMYKHKARNRLPAIGSRR